MKMTPVMTRNTASPMLSRRWETGRKSFIVGPLERKNGNGSICVMPPGVITHTAAKKNSGLSNFAQNLDQRLKLLLADALKATFLIVGDDFVELRQQPERILGDARSDHPAIFIAARAFDEAGFLHPIE